VTQETTAAHSTGLGAVFLPQLPPERLRGMVHAAEASGLEELWLWEDCFRQSGIASAAAALAWSERLVVGVGLLPVPLRNVALTAMELANLHRMFPGRARLGVGHGVQDWMGQVGERVDSPLTLLREHVTALRSLLAGEQVTTAGRYVQLDRVALDWPPAGPVPVLAGAVGPKSLSVSGEVADGTILSGGTSPDGVRQARASLQEGRRLGDRHDRHPVVVYVLAATGPGAAQRLDAERRSWGYPDGDTAIAGPAEVVADAVRRWADAGADTVVLQPTADDPDPEGFVRFVAEQVRPLVP